MAVRTLDKSTRRRLTTVALWTGALAISVIGYGREDETVHFAWHLAYGASAGLLASAAYGLAHGTRSPAAGLWALGGYGFMVVPDVLWIARDCGAGPCGATSPG